MQAKVTRSWVVTAGSPAQAVAQVTRPEILGRGAAVAAGSSAHAGQLFCFSMTSLMLAGVLGGIVGVGVGWWLATAMEVGKAVAPVAAAAIKAAPLAALA